MGPELDYKKIVANYAKRHPKEFCSFCVGDVPDFKQILATQGKVAAVREYRDYAKVDLKGAVEYINKLKDEKGPFK